MFNSSEGLKRGWIVPLFCGRKIFSEPDAQNNPKMVKIVTRWRATRQAATPHLISLSSSATYTRAHTLKYRHGPFVLNCIKGKQQHVK